MYEATRLDKKHTQKWKKLKTGALFNFFLVVKLYKGFKCKT